MSSSYLYKILPYTDSVDSKYYPSFTLKLVRMIPIHLNSNQIKYTQIRSTVSNHMHSTSIANVSSSRQPV